MNRQRRNKWKAETHQPINNGHASRRTFLNRIIRTLNMLQLSSKHTLRPVTRLIILRLVLLSIPSRRRITIDLAHARVRGTRDHRSQRIKNCDTWIVALTPTSSFSREKRPYILQSAGQWFKAMLCERQVARLFEQYYGRISVSTE